MIHDIIEETDIITEAQLSLFATDLIERLEVIDRALEIEDRKPARSQPKKTVEVGPWLCEKSSLDFLARPGPKGLPVPISAPYSGNHARKYRAQIAVCCRCSTRAECAELGASEAFGIWGATLPHEREL